MKKMNIKNSILILILMIIFGCNSTQNQIDESATAGNIKISCDEQFQLIIDTEAYTFQSLYKYAKLQVAYKNEAEVITDFMNDSVRTIITSKELTDQQKDALAKKSYIARTTTIAYDALAFIINRDNMDTLMRYPEIQDILTGKITSWKQLDPKSKLDSIKVVFDHTKSSNTRYIAEKFELKSFPKNFYAKESNKEVVDFVERNKNVIGIIGVNWISDKDDSITRGFLEKIRVLAISSPIAPDGPDYYRPYQAYIATQEYPFIRNVYMICRETFVGLGSGFVQFVAGESGQRIILKSGLVPSTMPIRIIKTRKE
jgi:phosphate transport system substrate-binding protein